MLLIILMTVAGSNDLDPDSDANNADAHADVDAVDDADDVVRFQ